MKSLLFQTMSKSYIKPNPRVKYNQLTYYWDNPIAPFLLASIKMASVMIAFVKSAPSRLAPVKSAPERLASIVSEPKIRTEWNSENHHYCPIPDVPQPKNQNPCRYWNCEGFFIS